MLSSLIEETRQQDDKQKGESETVEDVHTCGCQKTPGNRDGLRKPVPPPRLQTRSARAAAGLFGALEIDALRRIDADSIAFLDERRDLNRHAGFELCRLRAV